MVRSILAALSGSVLAASLALAQTPPPAAPAPEPPSASGPAARGMEALEQRLAALHRNLLITPAQEPQWEAFAIAVRQNAKNMAELLSRKVGANGAMDALQQLRVLSDTARLRADDLQRLVPPFEALYNTMSPEQRTVADRVVRQIAARSEPRQGDQ